MEFYDSVNLDFFIIYFDDSDNWEKLFLFYTLLFVFIYL